MRDHPRYLHTRSDFLGHTMDGGQNTAGIDYGPAAASEVTAICPIAAGVIIGHLNNKAVSGMGLIIAHGLGWKSEYWHLASRYVGFRDKIRRRDVIATMGRMGLATNRATPVAHPDHLHLNLLGPAYSPIFDRSRIQHRPKNRPGFQHYTDAELFSLAGPDAPLPYSRGEDAWLDLEFGADHAAAVSYCDQLLDRIDDEGAREAKRREKWEIESQFDYQVDQRMWFLWQRLQDGPHPFSAREVDEHRATLRRFMGVLPTFTAPIVEPDRRGEYRIIRASPLKVSEN
jgi:hypothetical protein